MIYSSLLEILQIDSSRAVADAATNFIGSDEKRFDEIVNLAENNPYPINMRAARVVELSAQKNKELIAKRIDTIVRISATHKNDGVKRAYIKVTEAFLPFEISDDLLGLVINNCFEKLNGIETVSVKYYSIRCLFKILKREPDLKHELIETLENQIGLNTRAFDRYIKKRLKGLITNT